MQGGVNPELGIEYYEDLLTALTKKHPNIQLDVFSPIEISGISEVTGLSTLEVLQRLQAVGMHGLPGGGAEMLVDAVRSDISPKKGAADDWIRIMREAQSLSLTTSATNVIGFGESKKDRVMHLSKIRGAQDAAQAAGHVGFTSFIAWPVQLENNVFGRRNKGENRLTLGVQAVEYLRHVAISRLFLDNIGHIQASWPTMGLDVAQIALFGGADDIGSTMMEENVVSASGTTRVQVSEKELQEKILRAGFTPMRRNSDYDLLETPDLKLGIQELPCPPPVV
jgi:CofH subfamily radical SAM domain protein